MTTSSTPGTAWAWSWPAMALRIPSPGMGIIITPAAWSLALEGGDVLAQGMSQHQLLEREAGAKTQGAGAQAADGAGGDLDDHGRTAGRQAELGVDRAGSQAQRGGGGGGRGLDGLLGGGGQARGGDVDGLLEERAVERVRLVEQGQGAEHAPGEQPFQRDLRARDERFAQDLTRSGGVQLQQLGGLQQPAQASEGEAESGGVVGAHDPAAAGQQQGFEHAGPADLAADPAGGRGRVLVEGKTDEARGGDAGCRTQGAHGGLVPGRRGRAHAVRGEVQRLGGHRRHQRGSLSFGRDHRAHR